MKEWSFMVCIKTSAQIQAYSQLFVAVFHPPSIMCARCQCRFSGRMVLLAGLPSVRSVTLGEGVGVKLSQLSQQRL